MSFKQKKVLVISYNFPPMGDGGGDFICLFCLSFFVLLIIKFLTSEIVIGELSSMLFIQEYIKAVFTDCQDRGTEEKI